MVFQTWRKRSAWTASLASNLDPAGGSLLRDLIVQRSLWTSPGMLHCCLSLMRWALPPSSGPESSFETDRAARSKHRHTDGLWFLMLPDWLWYEKSCCHFISKLRADLHGLNLYFVEINFCIFHDLRFSERLRGRAERCSPMEGPSGLKSSTWLWPLQALRHLVKLASWSLAVCRIQRIPLWFGRAHSAWRPSGWKVTKHSRESSKRISAGAPIVTGKSRFFSDTQPYKANKSTWCSNPKVIKWKKLTYFSES